MNLRPLWITAYNDAFKPIAEGHFLDSFHSLGLAKDFDLVVHRPESDYGTFATDVFRSSYAAELGRVIEVLQDNVDRLVVWTDADMRWYKNPIADIHRLWQQGDILCSMDSPPGVEPRDCCTGIQFFNVTPKLLEFYRFWRSLNEDPKYNVGHSHAQVSFNDALVKFRIVRATALPNTYWTHGLVGQRVWDGRNLDDLPDPPEDLVVHHANYTIGVSNKVRLLEEMQRRVRERKVL